MSDKHARKRSKYTADRMIPGAFEGETVTRRRFMTGTAHTAGAIAALDAEFPWLRGAEVRRPAKSQSHSNPHRTRALTAEREKQMQDSIPGGITLIDITQRRIGNR